MADLSPIQTSFGQGAIKEGAGNDEPFFIHLFPITSIELERCRCRSMRRQPPGLERVEDNSVTFSARDFPRDFCRPCPEAHDGAFARTPRCLSSKEMTGSTGLGRNCIRVFNSAKTCGQIDGGELTFRESRPRNGTLCLAGKGAA